MAFTFPTSLATVESFAGALYGYTVGSATMAQVNADITSYGGLNNALNAYYTAGFGSTPTATVAATIVANVGLTGAAATAGTAAITAALNAAAPSARGAVVVSLLNTFAGLTADPTYGSAASAWVSNVNSSVTYEQTNTTDATVAAAVKTVAAAAAAAATAGQTYKLTTGVDTFVGTSGNDTFDATTNANSFGPLDSLTGNGGTDTLNIASTSAFTSPAGVTVSGIANVNVNSTAAITWDLTTAGYSGIQNLTVAQSGAAVSLTAPSSAVTTVTNATPGGNSTVVYGGNNDTVTVTGAVSSSDSVTVGSKTYGYANGTVTVNYTSTATPTNANLTQGAITVSGGTTVNVTNTVKSGDTSTYTNSVINGTTSVTGSSKTTTVSVTQETPAVVTASVASHDGTNSKVSNTAGVTDGVVTIADANSTSLTATNTISSVTLANYGNSTIASSALTSLTLSQAGTDTTGTAISSGTLGLTEANTTQASSTLAINFGGGTLGTITDNSAIFSTINANLTASTRVAISDTALTTLNLSGTGVLRIDTLPATVSTLTEAGAAGYRGNVSSSAVTSMNFAASSGANTVTLNDKLQSFTGGSGASNVTISADATKAINGGTSGANTLTLGAVAGSTFTAANTGANTSNFQILATNATTGTVDVSAFTGDSINTISYNNTVNGSTTFNNVPSGAAVKITSTTAAGSGPTTGTLVVNYNDYTGFTDSVNLTLVGGTPYYSSAAVGTGTIGTTTYALTLQDANSVGVGNLNVTTDGTVAGSYDTITTLNDTYLSNLTISGTAGLQITSLTENGATLTIKDTDTSTGASNIGTLTATSLANISYSGTKNFATAIASDTAASFTASNANTGSTGVLTINSSTIAATKITLSGSVAATLTDSATGSVKVSAASDNQNLTLDLHATDSSHSDNITVGNGTNVIKAGAGTNTITTGSGANTVTPTYGSANNGETITFGSHAGVVDTIVLSAAQSTAGAVTNGSTVLSAAVGTVMVYGMLAGDAIDLHNISTTEGSTIDAVYNNAAGNANYVDVILGNYNTVTGTFTKSSTGTDTLVEYNTAASTQNEIVLVGFAGTATNFSAATGVITIDRKSVV